MTNTSASRSLLLATLLLATCALSLGGCQRTRTPSPPATSPDPSSDMEAAEPLGVDPVAARSRDVATAPPPESGSAAAEFKASARSETTDPPQARSAAEVSTANETDDKSGRQVAANTGQTADGPAGSPPPCERIILLATGGPLLIDVQIRLGGRSYTTALDPLIEQALAAADDDGDGQPTWEEVANSPRFAYGQFGNLMTATDEERAQLIEMYDRNRDGIVNREELPRFLTRNAGGARPFSMKSSNEYRFNNRANSPLRRQLDQDHNGAITAEEMAAAPQQMLRLDADDDEILVIAELQGDEEPRPRRLSNRRRIHEPDTAILIDDQTRWGYVEFAIRELYSFGDPIGTADWPTTGELFRKLDADQNEQLSRQEIAGLGDVAPHLVLGIDFGSESNHSDGGRELKLLSIAPEIESQVVAVHRHPTRLSIEFRAAEVEFFVNEDSALTNVRQFAEGQLRRLDADANGYLDENEFMDNTPGGGAPLEAVDQDADAMVDLEEFVRFLDLRQAAFRGQVRARAADQRDALFAALDSDGDGRLNAREIQASPRQLERLDRNGDQRLQSHEIPGCMVVGFVRGNPQADDGLFVMPQVRQATVDDSTPRWFLGMDGNGDGEVSRREFLGTGQQFAEFDRNNDGFIAAGELVRP